MTSIAIATEDELSEQVALRLVNEAGLDVNMTLRNNGNGYLRRSIDKFIAMSAHYPVLVITDLDLIQTPQKLISQWFQHRKRPAELLFHVAVREVEAWLLADHQGMKELLGGKIGKLPNSPESVQDPKANLLGLATRASREVRADLVAERNSMASQGLGYNSRLSLFVKNIWDPRSASERSPSLAALRTELMALGGRRSP